MAVGVQLLHRNLTSWWGSWKDVDDRRRRVRFETAAHHLIETSDTFRALLRPLEERGATVLSISLALALHEVDCGNVGLWYFAAIPTSVAIPRRRIIFYRT